MLLKQENPVMFVPFSLLSHCSAVFLVKEMSTSLISISEGRTSSYLFWLFLVLLWPSLAEEIWISSMPGCKSCSSMRIQEEVFLPQGFSVPQGAGWWLESGYWRFALSLEVDVLSIPLFLFYFLVGKWVIDETLPKMLMWSWFFVLFPPYTWNHVLATFL